MHNYGRRTSQPIHLFSDTSSNKILLGLDQNFLSQRELSHELLIQGVVTLNVIWQLRNSLLLEGTVTTPEEAARITQRRTDQYISAWQSKLLPPFNEEATTPTTDPKTSFGVAFRNGSAWVAALCTNKLGTFVQAWTASSGTTDPTLGEAEAAKFCHFICKIAQLSQLYFWKETQWMPDLISRRFMTGVTIGNHQANSLLCSLGIWLAGIHYMVSSLRINGL